MKVIGQGGCISTGRECAVSGRSADSSRGSNPHIMTHVLYRNMCMIKICYYYHCIDCRMREGLGKTVFKNRRYRYGIIF